MPLVGQRVVYFAGLSSISYTATHYIYLMADCAEAEGVAAFVHDGSFDHFACGDVYSAAIGGFKQFRAK